jgi:hypothetical protein
MPSFSRASAIATLALVVVVGAGGWLYLSASRAPSGVGGPATPAAPTSAPAPTPSAVPSFIAQGISAWHHYTSTVYDNGYGSVDYPADWSVVAQATRAWEPGDRFPVETSPYADVFASPGEGDETVGLVVWKMPAGEGAEVETVEGLKAWAATFCRDVGMSPCDGFTQDATPMCLDTGGVCRGALLVPTPDQQFAFFVDWGSAMMTVTPDRVRVVVVPREDAHPSASRYGGSVQLLRSILTKMNVWTPGQQPPRS